MMYPLSRVVARALGTTPTGDPSLLPRRTGYGWTILIKPGNYRETLTINVPLTLKKFDGSPGTVVIGQDDNTLNANLMPKSVWNSEYVWSVRSVHKQALSPISPFPYPHFSEAE